MYSQCTLTLSQPCAYCSVVVVHNVHSTQPVHSLHCNYARATLDVHPISVWVEPFQNSWTSLLTLYQKKRNFLEVLFLLGKNVCQRIIGIIQRPVSAYRRIGKNLVSAHPYLIPYVRVTGPVSLGNMDRLKLLFFWKRLYDCRVVTIGILSTGRHSPHKIHVRSCLLEILVLASCHYLHAVTLV